MGRILTHPVTGDQVHVGGLKLPPPEARKLRMAAFLSPSYAYPKTYTAVVNPATPGVLGRDAIWGNNAIGNCAECCAFRDNAIKRYNAAAYGPPYVTAQVEGLYSRVTGWSASKPNSDDGTDPTVLLDSIQKNGLLPDGSHKIAGWLAVDATNESEVKAAASIFEGCMIAASLFEAWVDPFPSAPGQWWGAKYAGNPQPQDGHMFKMYGYGPNSYQTVPWGGIYNTHIAIDALAECASGQFGDLYISISQEMLNAKTLQAPDAMDWAALTKAFTGFGGSLAA